MTGHLSNSDLDTLIGEGELSLNDPEPLAALPEPSEPQRLPQQGEPLDVKVNGAPFAKAEVVVLNGNYGLRIVELNSNGLSGLKS